MKRTTFLLATTISGLLTGCQSIKIESWSSPEFKARPLGKTMVLCIAESEYVRRQSEALMVQRLLNLGIPADSLHMHYPSAEKLSEDELAEALKMRKFDSILVTRPISQSDVQQLVATGTYPAYYDNYYGFYSFAFNTSYVTGATEHTIETCLYDVQSKRMVWVGRETIYGRRTDVNNMKKVVRSIVRDLQKQDMID